MGREEGGGAAAPLGHREVPPPNFCGWPNLVGDEGPVPPLSPPPPPGARLGGGPSPSPLILFDGRI